MSSICSKSAYGNEGIALILLGAEDRVVISSLLGALDETDSSTDALVVRLGDSR